MKLPLGLEKIVIENLNIINKLNYNIQRARIIPYCVIKAFAVGPAEYNSLYYFEISIPEGRELKVNSDNDLRYQDIPIYCIELEGIYPLFNSQMSKELLFKIQRKEDLEQFSKEEIK